MTIKEKYQIKEVNVKTAQSMVIKNHYLHRKASCSQAFGLFENNELIGVVMYGTPPSSTLRECCGKEHVNDVIELSRLWIKDNTEKNVESYLVGNTLKKVNKPIIISYADSSEGHIGKIYQATNFIYTGLSKVGFYYKIPDNPNIHFNYTMLDKYPLKKIRKMYPNLQKVPRTRKHRYIYFNCSKMKKKHLLSKLRYKILPYPK